MAAVAGLGAIAVFAYLQVRSPRTVNAPTNSNVNTTVNTNAVIVVPAGWSTYSSPTYGFTISHPPELTVQATTLSDAVKSQMVDGLVASAGIYTVGPHQGPLYLVRVFAKPLEEVVVQSDLVGPLTGTVKPIGMLRAREVGQSIRAYGIEGPDYTYVVSVQNYSSDADLATFDNMLMTFRLE